MDHYKMIISPETIKGDLVTVDYKGQEVGVYSAMTQVVTGGTDGTSILTGLTIPILIRQDVHDVGYFTPFDGALIQQNVVTNFIFSSTTDSPYVFYVYNTSYEFQKFIELSYYTVDWGDGSELQTITQYAPEGIIHAYPEASANYTITLTQTNPWGQVKISKNVTTPYELIQSNNPNGTAYFVPKFGSWWGTPISYNYIFSGDAVNVVSAQTSNNYASVPYFISGTTYSRLTELAQYTQPTYQVGVPVIQNGEIFGAVTDINDVFTAYTIQTVSYYDYPDGTTIYFEQSSGFTENNLTAEPIVKEEVLLGVIDQPQIQSNVFVERGKNSAYEKVQRLGEVNSIGDLLNYGYGFFNVVKKS